jgi:hypothetical protein
MPQRCATTDHWEDGEEILGIGDQGAGGILISVAKLLLTTVCGGIHPNRTLPVVLDCGTDNEALLNDDLYLGLREKRVRGDEYDKFVDNFVKSARQLFPRAYIHFEDFGLTNGTVSPRRAMPELELTLLQPGASWTTTARRSPALTTTSKGPAASPSPPSWPAYT